MAYPSLQSLAAKVLLFASVLASVLAARATPLQAGSMSKATGFISEDKASIQVSFSITGMETSELPVDETKYAERLDIILTDADTKPLLRAASLQSVTEKNNDFYWVLDNTPTKTPNATKYQVDFSITIYNNPLDASSKTIASLLDDKKGILVRPSFKPMIGNIIEYDTTGSLIPPIFGKPKEAPSDIVVSAVHRGALVKWAGQKKVEYTSGADAVTSFIPSSVLVLAFPSDAGPLTLAAKVVDDKEGKHSDTSCVYQYSADSSSCITCDAPEGTTDAKIFVDSSQPVEAATYKLTSNQNSNGFVAINGLEVGQGYVVALQYEGGAARSECFLVTPISTISLTEANGAAEGTEGDPRCFIATAAYGSSLHRHVSLFRWFRNSVLLPFAWGRRLVLAYYTYSPPLADAIAASPFLRAAVLSLLWPVALGLEGLQQLREAPPLFVNVLLLSVLLALGFLLIRVRQSQTRCVERN